MRKDQSHCQRTANFSVGIIDLHASECQCSLKTEFPSWTCCVVSLFFKASLTQGFLRFRCVQCIKIKVFNCMFLGRHHFIFIACTQRNSQNRWVRSSPCKHCGEICSQIKIRHWTVDYGKVRIWDLSESTVTTAPSTSSTSWVTTTRSCEWVNAWRIAGLIFLSFLWASLTHENIFNFRKFRVMLQSLQME